jgi:hypothetical protein
VPVSALVLWRTRQGGKMDEVQNGFLQVVVNSPCLELFSPDLGCLSPSYHCWLEWQSGLCTVAWNWSPAMGVSETWALAPMIHDGQGGVRIWCKARSASRLCGCMGQLGGCHHVSRGRSNL